MATFTYPAEIPEKRPDQSEEQFAAEMRARGLRQVTRWVPDLTDQQVLQEYTRQLEALARHQRAHPEELLELSSDDLKGWE